MDNIKIKGFHHINIKAQNFEETELFYSKLGFVRVYSWKLKEFNISKCVMMLNPEIGMYIEICDRDANMPTQGRTRKEGEEYTESALMHICFFVENAESAFENAIKAGAKCLSASGQITLKDEDGNELKVTNSLVYSPNGEVIEFMDTDPFAQMYPPILG